MLTIFSILAVPPQAEPDTGADVQAQQEDTPNQRAAFTTSRCVADEKEIWRLIFHSLARSWCTH